MEAVSAAVLSSVSAHGMSFLIKVMFKAVLFIVYIWEDVASVHFIYPPGRVILHSLEAVFSTRLEEMNRIHSSVSQQVICSRIV